VALEVARLAIVPPPPPIFSEIKEVPVAWESLSAIVRAIKSKPPPGCAGTIILIGFVLGHASLASNFSLVMNEEPKEAITNRNRVLLFSEIRGILSPKRFNIY
jgi:hypothetical protein